MSEPTEVENTEPEAVEEEVVSPEKATTTAAAKPEVPKPAPPATKTDAWTPPTKAEFDAVQVKLKEANAESATRRKKLDALERAQESDAEKKVREAVDAANAASKPRIVKAEAKLALVAAEARPERVTALTRFLDMDKIELDGDDVTGLDDQVVKLKAEYPEFFKQPEEPAKKTTPKVPVAGKAPADAPRTVGERIAAGMGK